MKKRSALSYAVLILLIVGGLNWGLVGLMNWNLVTALLGKWPMAVKTVYVLVGLAALVKLYKVATR